MEDVIRSEVLKKVKHKEGVHVSVHIVKANIDLSEYLCALYEHVRKNLTGIYQNWTSSGRRFYYRFECIRAGNQRPLSQRNVNCNAYISFVLHMEYTGYIAITQYVNDNHTGHCPSAAKDLHHVQMSSELVEEITKLLKLGVAPDVILINTQAWAQQNGYNDPHDRRYYATPDDIANLRKRVLAETRMEANDSSSTHTLLTEQYKNNVLFYQSFLEGVHPFICVLQTPEMKAALKANGQHVLFIDATHQLNQYGYPLYTIMVRDEQCNGHPVFYLIIGSDDQETLQIALQRVRASLSNFPK